MTDNLTNATLAYNQGRADALMWDDTVLVGLAAADRNSKLTNDVFLALPYGIGIRQGNTAMKRWVDSRLELMRKKDTLHVDPAQQRRRRGSCPRSRGTSSGPRNTFRYAPRTARRPETVCP